MTKWLVSACEGSNQIQWWPGHDQFISIMGYVNWHSTEWYIQQRVSETYIRSNLCVNVFENTLTTATTTITSRKNRLLGAMSISIGPGATGVFEDLVNSDSLVFDDTCNNRIVVSSEGAGGLRIGAYSSIFEAATDIPPQGPMSSSGINIGLGSAHYYHAGGEFIRASLPENYTVRVDLIITNLWIYVRDNSLDGNSVTRIRKNDASGNVAVTVGAGASGAFSDDVNSDSLTNGDLLGMQVDNSAASSGYIRICGISFKSSSASRLMFMACAARGVPGGLYFPLEGSRCIGDGSSETVNRTKALVQFTAKHMFILVSFTGTIPQTTFVFRKNSVNGNMTITVPALSSGAFEDLVHTDSVASTDLINWYADNAVTEPSAVVFEQGLPEAPAAVPTSSKLSKLIAAGFI